MSKALVVIDIQNDITKNYRGIIDRINSAITYRAMMGEYILYYRERVIGGIYDDRFLVKPVRAAVNLMPNAEMEVPYEGAKGMLLVDDVDDREYLVKLFEAMYDELPERKKK